MDKDSCHQTMIDVSAESVSGAIVELIDSVDDREMEELPVLYDAIGVDALNELFSPQTSGTDRNFECTVSFCYADYEIHIDSISSQGPSIRLVAEKNEKIESLNEPLNRS